jgi:hypothetical protein
MRALRVGINVLCYYLQYYQFHPSILFWAPETTINQFFLR